MTNIKAGPDWRCKLCDLAIIFDMWAIDSMSLPTEFTTHRPPI